MNPPRLAICIPAFNAARFLPVLFESLAAQTEPFDEIWVHDDCSTDDTAAVAHKLGARVLTSDANVGCSLGKDRLLRTIDSEFVHFHDADDVLLPGFVARARRWMARPDCPDVVLFAYEYRDHASGDLLDTVCFDDTAISADPMAYCIANPICPFSGLYRTAAVRAAGGYLIPDSQLLNEDKAFHCRLARSGLSFRADSQVAVINYRVGDSMSLSNLSGCARAQYEVMAEAARLSGRRYHDLIAARLWRIASVSGAHADWQAANAAAALACELSDGGPPDGHWAYRWLARRAPRTAIRCRQAMISLLGKRPA